MLSRCGPAAVVGGATATALLLAVASLSPAFGHDPSSHPTDRSDGSGCTVVYAADESGAYGGNNEDERNPLTRIWFVPGDDGAYGSVFVGYDDLVMQGGMNEGGLFYDALGVREVQVPGRPGKPEYTGENFVADVMSSCDSVTCVLERFESVSMAGTWNGQYLFGDRFGDSAIVEPLTVIPKSGSFQVATNFFQSEVPPAKRTDQRYRSAMRMLGESPEISAELVRDVLDATHQEGTVNTVYSTIYDLEARTVHLYYFSDFSHDVTFDLRAELADGVHGYEIAELFPPNDAAERVAAPIRAQVADALAQYGTAGIDPSDLGHLAGTYEVAPGLALFVSADGGTLRVRRATTPWVDPVPVSATDFVRVFSDAEGNVHEQELRFDLASGDASQVELIGDGGERVVAYRIGSARHTVPWPAVGIGVIAIAAVPIVALVRAVRRGRAASNATRALTRHGAS